MKSQEISMVHNMLGLAAMLHLRGAIGPILALLLGLAAPAYSRAATFTPPQQMAENSLDWFVSLSVSEFGSAISRMAATTTKADVLETYRAASMGGEDSYNDMNNVVRHRGFIKALLIIIASGALVRFLTSPTFLDFISDALDPRAW
jgi:hypothetical protein